MLKTQFNKLYNCLILLMLLLYASCFSVSYNFKGVQIPEALETVSVQYFENRVSQSDPYSFIEPSISQTVTDEFKEYLQSNTKLSLVNGIGDVDFEGYVTQYSTRSITVAQGDQAASNRFTIGIRIIYTNSLDESSNFDQTFSRYIDYPSSQSFESAQSEYTEELLDLLIEDAFNRAFSNW